MLPVCTASAISATWAVAQCAAEGSSEFVRRMFVEERFFLQVVDGFVLPEAKKDRNSLSNGLVLVKNSTAGRWAGDLLSESVVLAQQEDYVLMRVPRW